MAIYAPKTPGQANHTKVASLVEANAAAQPTSSLTSLTVDEKQYSVMGALFGRDGDVPYLGRQDASVNGYKPETIFRSDVYVCENREDYEKSLSAAVTMREIFDTWVKGGRIGDKWYGYDSDYPTNDLPQKPLSGLLEWLEWNRWNSPLSAPSAWSDLDSPPSAMSTWRWPEDGPFGHPYGYSYWFYAPSVSSIIQPANTYDDSYFVSPYMMSSYDITVRCRSYSNIDDDIIGLVAAEVKGKDGKPQFLAVCRSCNGLNTANWVQPYAHFYMRANAVWANANWTPDPEYCDGKLSSTFLSDRKYFQTRFTNVTRPYDALNDRNISKYYVDSDKYLPFGSPEEHLGGWYWPSLSAHPSAYVNELSVNDQSCFLSNDHVLVQASSFFNINYDGGSARAFWATHPLKYEYDHRGTGEGELSLDLDLSGGMANPKNWWWLNDDLWRRHTSSTTSGVAYDPTWRGMGYCYMRVRRSGNSISAWTTKMTAKPRSSLGGDQGGPTSVSGWTDAQWNSGDNASYLYVNLEDDKSLDGVNLLSTFSLQASPLGGAVGFITASQPGASWDILDMKIPRILVQTWTNQLIQYDPITGEENVMPYNPQQYCGRGRLCKNNATGKTFYVCDSGFLKVVDPSSASTSEEWTFTLENGDSTEEIKKKIVVV